MKNNLKISNSRVCLYNSQDKDLNISEVGYNDFKFIKAINNFRIQGFYTLHFVSDGKGILQYNNKTYYLTMGDIFILPDKEPFKYFPEKNNPWKYFWFAIQGNTIKEHFNKITKRFDGVKVSVELNKNLISSINEFLISFKSGIEIGYYKILSLFFLIIDELEYCQPIQTSNKLITKAKEFIYLNASNSDFTVEMLCKLLYISHTYLGRLFLQQTGKSIRSYITEVKMQNAMKLLVTSDIHINQIAYQSGYNDEINFMKAFKKYYGNPCGYYRKK